MFGECHAHIALDGTNYRYSVQQHTKEVNEEVVRARLREYQQRSISFVRDGGDNLGVSLFARSIAQEYDIDYRTPSFALHKNGHYGSIVGQGFESLKDYASLIDTAAADGADFIKIMTTGIMDFNAYGSVIMGPPLSKNEVKEMVHIAHEKGFAVMSHTNGAQAILEALECGVDSLEHGNYINNEGIQALRETRAIFIPTATVARNHVGRGRFDDSTLKRIAESSEQAIARAFSQDVLIALGSDAGASGVLHGQGTFDEYAFFAGVIPDKELLDERLSKGEQALRDVFRRR